jgi:hypothetical protein
MADRERPVAYSVGAADLDQLVDLAYGSCAVRDLDPDDFALLARVKADQVSDPPCGLCGGYGALNEVTREPVPCLACGKESTGMVLTAVDPFDQAEPGEQRGGLRVVDGGREVAP